MKNIVSILFIASVFVFSGCFNQDSGQSVGGVMKSIDGGRTFKFHNFIDEQRSLAGSNVLTLAIDPVNTDVVYAGTMSNDLFKTVDGAQSWELLQTSLQSIRNVVVSPFSTQTIYVSGLFQGRGSVVKTVDGGLNWDRIYVEPTDGTNITAVAMSPANGNTVYIGTSGGTIARTVDSGVSWENLRGVGSAVADIQIDKGNANIIYALLGSADIIKTIDGGETFVSIENMERGEDAQMYQGALYSMSISPSVPGAMIVGTDQGIFKSVDYGATWQPIDVIASTLGIPIHGVAISPHDENRIVYAAAKAVYISVPDGWAITDTTSNRTVRRVVHDPISPDIVYIVLISAN